MESALPHILSVSVANNPRYLCSPQDDVFSPSSRSSSPDFSDQGVSSLPSTPTPRGGRSESGDLRNSSPVSLYEEQTATDSVSLISSCSPSTSVDEKIFQFLNGTQPQTPCVVISVDSVERAYVQLKTLLPSTDVFYAIKANPARAVLDRLVSLGCRFDTASPNEIQQCLDAGATPERISFGNTIKKQQDIAFAYSKGVRLYAFDCIAELRKLAAAAPGCKVFCRILVDGSGAEWPLSRKFGCEPSMAVSLLEEAHSLGLEAYGVSFHVGSQQTNLASWDGALARVADIFRTLAARNVKLQMVNLGGGFPAHYRSHIPTLETYARCVMTAMNSHFDPANLPRMIMEPGRSLVGDAGVIQAEVILISKKNEQDPKRWVYLDCGKFNGLPETMDESIKYVIRTPHDGKPTGPAVIAGPTCDSADIMYEKTEYHLPLDLAIGDKVLILSTGAYTSTYASVCFNGFDPIRTYCV
jgi:ornithine decarboxylase